MALSVKYQHKDKFTRKKIKETLLEFWNQKTKKNSYIGCRNSRSSPRRLWVDCLRRRSTVWHRGRGCAIGFSSIEFTHSWRRFTTRSLHQTGSTIKVWSEIKKNSRLNQKYRSSYQFPLDDDKWFMNMFSTMNLEIRLYLLFFFYKNQGKNWKFIKNSMKHSDIKWETKYPTKYIAFSDPVLLQVQEFGNEKREL